MKVIELSRLTGTSVHTIRYYEGIGLLKARRNRSNGYHEFSAPGFAQPASPLAALVQKWLHPMRVSRYVFAERVIPWKPLSSKGGRDALPEHS